MAMATTTGTTHPGRRSEQPVIEFTLMLHLEDLVQSVTSHPVHDGDLKFCGVKNRCALAHGGVNARDLNAGAVERRVVVREVIGEECGANRRPPLGVCLFLSARKGGRACGCRETE